MKRVIAFIIINLILVLIQESFLGNLLGTFTPNLVLAFAFSFLILNLDDIGFMNAFIGGVLLDLFGFETIGLSSLVFVGSLMMYFFIRKYLFRGWIFTIFSSFVVNILYLYVVSGFSASSRLLINSSASTALFAMFFFFSIRNLSGYFDNSEYRLKV